MKHIKWITIIFLLLLESTPISANQFPVQQRFQRSPTSSDKLLVTDRILHQTPSPTQSAQDDSTPSRTHSKNVNGKEKQFTSMPTNTVFLSNARAAANRVFKPDRGSTLKNAIRSAKDRFHYTMKYRTQACTNKKLGVMTNLSGGAETGENPITTSETTTPNPSTQSTTAAFLGTLRHKQKNLLPNIVKANEATLRKVKEGMNTLQRKGAQVTPPVVTFLSVLWNADKGVSFLSLYGLALLGASCGFHLFLYFITVGYAAGITIPVAVALRIYKVYCVQCAFLGSLSLLTQLFVVSPKANCRYRLCCTLT